ncbi:MAG TPA: prolyl oligopeptidase family serine peptidase [Flavobacterium sp.]|jgi:predicted peptidase|nr:prolyl oligopeptidase family serine peptidase [Flavobacterium sp.]HQV34677.1 prolyl oligopeptidase family serine peptidase [Flavobacterium sp.]HQX02718.1 prolyl oligopeptidase family serine peptidase [Flavobacterium sp.]HRZ73648.1 prolyl oligopeptidase family serine peptidase [Flavobacterium sp.]
MKKLVYIMLFLPLLCLGQMETNGTIKAELVTKFELNYLLQKPNNNKDLKPLIIFLHGSGEKGTDLEKLKIHGPLKYAKTHELDAYILAPQCPENKYWESEELYLLIQKVLAENKIDKSRIYLTGLSMGAWGSWNLAFAHPELFAALVPIAGFVDRVPMVENCKISTIPIRIFHGLQDDIVDANYSIAIFNKLRGCNKDIKLQLFDDANHDSWTRVYDNPAIYEWMLMQKK